MANHPLFPKGNIVAGRGAGTAVIALLATCTALAQHDRERDKKPDTPPAKSAPAERPSREVNRPAPAEPRRESRPEPRREAPSEMRRESRPEPRREAPGEIRRESRPEPKRETPTPVPGSRQESSSSASVPRREPGIAPRPLPSRESRRDPAPTPRPTPGAGRLDGPRGDSRPGPASHIVRTRDGGEIHRTNSGAIREVRTSGGAVIRHSPSGVRNVEMHRPGGTVIVANATGRRGYVQRPLMIRDHSFVQRTYIHNGVPHARIYRPWSHGGRVYHIYTPTHYYRPSFYSYIYAPWSRPVSYSWGWNARPWYGYYGGYFSPYRHYSSPAFWLADFLIATTLETAYLAQRASVSAPPVVYTEATALSPEVKQLIAEEVRRQMDQEREDQERYRDAGPSNAEPALFSERGPRVFLVSNTLMAFAGNQECPLVEGDVLQLLRTPSPSAEMADVRVMASRGGSCRKGSVISVRLTDLQEMQNQLRSTLDQGMTKLQADQGRDGIPSLPSSAVGTVNMAYADEVRPDSNAADQITQVVQEANRSEQAIIDQGPQDDGDPSGSPTISLGMTIAEVERSMGRPKNTVDLGSKKIHVYQNLKITFLNGRVSDVQ